jgi:type II secretory ATPase GspE/PulE/Tfp pilus assembly ATPase PilB-like protein
VLVLETVGLEAGGDADGSEVTRMLSAGAIDRLVWLGGAWIVLAVAWAAFCIWVEEDAAEIIGEPLPWTLGSVVAGALLFLVTYQYGLGYLPLFLVVLPAAALGYVVYRDSQAASTRTILSRRFARELVLAAARKIGAEEAVMAWFRADHGPSGGHADTGVILLKKDGSLVDGQSGKNLDRETSRAVKTVQQIFEKAIEMRATDVHLEPKAGEEVQVRCRIDGIMQNIATLQGATGKAAISAIKVCADMDIAERRRPQDGAFAVLKQTKKFDVRAATGPTNFGEKMVLRLLDADGGVLKAGLASLGMRESMLKSLQSIIHQPHGMLIVCGPTGSGKTTTLYVALGEIDVLSRNIVTIEDPIEYRLENISQTAVNPAADLTFAKILRSVLRQDPDVILVGEIRDKETAEIAMQAALTGHFVFTTLHANDTATTVTRLLDIGIETSLIQSAVTAVLAQRLVRVLCQKCKEPYPAPEDFRQKVGAPPDKEITIYREKDKGCPACHGTGYKGRTGVHELLVFNNEVRELLVGHPSIQAIRNAARKAGMRTLQESGIAKVLAGITSINEIMRVTK